MPKWSDMAVGILILLTGLYTLVMMPALKRRLAKRQQAGEQTADEVHRELKNAKWMIFGSLVVGGSLICIYVFRLYE
jgi:formate-dependent nitrite reductase membrane component NrfD